MTCFNLHIPSLFIMCNYVSIENRLRDTQVYASIISSVELFLFLDIFHIQYCWSTEQGLCTWARVQILRSSRYDLRSSGKVNGADNPAIGSIPRRTLSPLPTCQDRCLPNHGKTCKKPLQNRDALRVQKDLDLSQSTNVPPLKYLDWRTWNQRPLEWIAF